MKNIAIIGASKDRTKFGNKCVRAYASKGYIVFPVNLHDDEVEGIKCYKSILDIDEEIDIVSLYLPRSATRKILKEIISKNPKLVYFNPGTEDLNMEKSLVNEDIEIIEECSILAIHINPRSLD